CSRSCVCVSVCPSVRLSTVFLGNRGNSERETWTYYQVGGMHGKIRFWSGARGSWRNGGLPSGCSGDVSRQR
ncbi:hypothetical protein GBAR_LOCUS11854, partial [Geodia barretti]